MPPASVQLPGVLEAILSDTITKQRLMSLNQVLAMLMAAQAQGAKYVLVVDKGIDGHYRQNGMEWVGMRPVGDTVYMATEGGGWCHDVCNEALESLDL